MLAVTLVNRPLIAMLIPFVVYIFESAALQILNLPGASFIISATYPIGLADYPLWQAIAPFAGLALLTLSVATIIIARAPSNPRFS